MTPLLRSSSDLSAVRCGFAGSQVRPRVRLLAAALTLLVALMAAGSGLRAAIARTESTLEYASVDGRKIPAVLSMPQGAGPFPVVVTIHGGQGDREISYLRTLAVANNATPTVTTLNEQPWAILSIDFRNGLFGLEEEDVVFGIRFAKTLPRVDPERVGVLGGSRGGHLALRAAEKMGREFLCVAVGSPWMTDPFVYMLGRADQPPLSQLSASSRTIIMDNGQQLYRGLLQRTGSDAAAQQLMRDFSIEANADRIVIPSLFLTSRSDEQAPHLLIKPTFDRLRALGRDVTVFTVEQSRHGFYWGRDEGGARQGLGPKNEVELAEEAATRDQIVTFFTTRFAAPQASTATPPVVISPLTNLSVRGRVGTGAGILISGFVVGEGAPRTVVLRAVGPTLATAPFNLSGVLARPTLELYFGSQRIASNVGWSLAGNVVDIRAAMARAGAFALPERSLDSVLLMTLPPGAYTLQVAGEGGTEGLVLAEVYAVP